VSMPTVLSGCRNRRRHGYDIRI